VGTATVSPYYEVGGRVHRRCMTRPRDGVSVVVRGRESRPHGEGEQPSQQYQWKGGEVALNNDTPWPSVADAKLRVLNIQRKLHQWSKADSERRFDDLYNLVCDRTTLLVAWDRVRSNRGSRTAGLDGWTRAPDEKTLAQLALVMNYQNASCTEPSAPIHQTSMLLGIRDTAAMFFTFGII